MDVNEIRDEFYSGEVTLKALEFLFPAFRTRIDRAALQAKLRDVGSLPEAIRAQIREQFAPEVAGPSDDENEEMDEDTAYDHEMRKEAIETLLDSEWRHPDDDVIELCDPSYALSCAGPEGSMTAYYMAWYTVEWDGGGALVLRQDSDYVDGDQYSYECTWEDPRSSAEFISDFVVEEWGEWLTEGTGEEPWIGLHGADLERTLDRMVGSTVERYCEVVQRVADERRMVKRDVLKSRVAKITGIEPSVVDPLLDHVFEHGTPPPEAPAQALAILRTAFWATWDSSWRG